MALMMQYVSYNIPPLTLGEGVGVGGVSIDGNDLIILMIEGEGVKKV